MTEHNGWVAMLMGAVITGPVVAVLLELRVGMIQRKFEAAMKALEGMMCENAMLRVAMAAGLASEEAKQICAVTLAALEASKPEKPVEIAPSEAA